MKVTDFWRQVDGGTRYLVEGRKYQVTVDEDKHGNLSGFVRALSRDDKRYGRVLKAGFEAVRAAVRDEE